MLHVPCYITENIGFYLLRKRRRYAPMWHVVRCGWHVASHFCGSYEQNTRVYLLAKYMYVTTLTTRIHTHTHTFTSLLQYFSTLHTWIKVRERVRCSLWRRESLKESALPRARCLCDLYTQNHEFPMIYLFLMQCYIGDTCDGKHRIVLDKQQCRLLCKMKL